MVAATTACTRKKGPWRFLTEAEAATLAAMCGQIIPTDQDPGAVELGAVEFVDRQLRGFHKAALPVYREGLAKLDAASVSKCGKTFAQAPSATQLELMKSFEKDKATREFFNMVVAHTMQGFYGGPRHGGNRNAASWKMLGVPYPQVRGRLKAQG